MTARSKTDRWKFSEKKWKEAASVNMEIKTYKDILFNEQKLNKKPDGKPWEFFFKRKSKSFARVFHQESLLT